MEATPMTHVQQSPQRSYIVRRQKRLMFLMALSLAFATAVPVLVLAGN